METQELIELIGEGDLACGRMCRVEPGGLEPLAVYNVNGVFYVTQDTCSHGGASLAEEGELSGCTVECSWHQGTFDVRTGEATASPCEVPLVRFDVVRKNGRIFVVKP